MTKRLLLLAFSLCSMAGAQTDSMSTRVAVTSDPPGSIVYLDSVSLGTAAVRDIATTAGRHILRCVSANDQIWPVAVSVETLMVQPGESVHCHCIVPRVYHVVSDPAGSEIVFGDSVIAATPCFLTDRYRGKPLTARSAGYDDGLLVLPESSGIVFLRLQPARAGSELPPGPLITESQQQNLLPVYVSSGAAILSGFAAAYFKIKADSYYNDYQATGDPELLDKIHRYDAISGVALVISQVSVGALAYFLLSR